ncbi:MAG: valine--tRNA ligase [Magnetococcales bacterium]|nr:valine--tRNA ligase [Magnetococcales bacterium]
MSDLDDTTLPKTYDPTHVEKRRYAMWEQSGYFSPGPKAGRDSYSLMIPPPNVTGNLHMGHAFQDTIMDALIRYHRMKGKQTLWQVGTDHAGIATQMVVERQLEAEGKTRHDLGREAFIDRVWAWKESSGGTIVHQLRRLGASCDWSREKFTMDRELSHAVQEEFVRLYNEGLIYRGKRLVNWDPVLHTAVSDLEVLSEQEEGFMWHMRYPLTDGSGFLTVATTRPETMLGDCAVAVHPEDERYRHLVGQSVQLPLTLRTIPIIADDYVDPEFGSGCVKITPAHDFNDHEVGSRHNLPLINIFTKDAAIVDEAPEPYRGLDRYVARKKVVADLDALGLLEKVEPHKLMVPRGDRSKAVIEPYLTDQWYVKTAPLAEEAIKAVEDGRIRFVPANWDKTYFEWMRNIQDWCISRQIWWGHQIPAWYGPDGHLFVCNCEEEVYELAAEHYGKLVTLTRDPDVLDTWFSSALWPFATLGWPKNTQEMIDFYPTNVLVTAFDIIFFWVARMVMMGLKFTDQVPFHDVYITGLVRDGEGHKMSKSKGNILDPLDLIDGIDLEALVAKRTKDMMQPHLAEKIAAATRKEFPDGIPPFGADALRFTMASLATQGRDIKFDLGRIEGYRNFCNKLWNATRFVLMNTEGQTCGADSDSLNDSAADRWILSRLQQVKKEVATAIEEYRFNDASSVAYQFIWGGYCDWYLEMVKPVIYGDEVSEASKIAARHCMVGVLEESLRLLHPLMPFITEELWQKVAPLVGREGPSIMISSWPEVDADRVDPALEKEMAWVMSFVTAVRTVRAEMDLSPGKRLVVLVSGSQTMVERLKRHEGLISVLARLDSWDILSGEAPEGAATGVVEEMQIFIPLAGLIDVDAETARLLKGLQKLEKDLLRVTGKLSNPNFLAKAKPEVVEKERGKQQEMEEKKAGLSRALERMEKLRSVT